MTRYQKVLGTAYLLTYAFALTVAILAALDMI